MPAEGPQLAKSKAAVRTRCPSVPSIASTRELLVPGPIVAPTVKSAFTPRSVATATRSCGRI